MRHIAILFAALVCACVTTSARAEEAWSVQKCTDELTATYGPPEQVAIDSIATYDGWDYRFFSGMSYDYICHQAELHRTERAEFTKRLQAEQDLSSTKDGTIIQLKDELTEKKKYISYLERAESLSILGGLMGSLIILLGGGYLALRIMMAIYRIFVPRKHGRLCRGK
ncbi:MAG: hypothetical protein ACM3TU_01585 [Bacillota bacterium]